MGVGTGNRWDGRGTVPEVSGLTRQMNYVPKRHVEAPTPSPSECCLVWKSGSDERLKWVLLYLVGLMTS